ncbi:hypothetical protein ES708_21939 [subsurface metagenome]
MEPHTVIVDSDKITFPDSTEQTTKAVRLATLVVAANNSTAKSKAQADYVCDGTNDHVEIQAALDALPATGGEVRLLEGTYNIEVSLVLDSYQTLRGCGRNTILTTTTADMIFLSAVGGLGTELTGIVIADMQIDGGAGLLGDAGIYFEYVDYSLVQNVYSRRHASGTGTFLIGIFLLHSDFNTLLGNTCRENGLGSALDSSNNNIVSSNIYLRNTDYGIYLSGALRNTIAENDCRLNGHDGIIIETSGNNTIIANSCYGNDDYGISVVLSLNNTITENDCRLNGREGIELDRSDNNIISNNNCFQNSQNTDNTYSNILAQTSDYNLIEGNLCRAPTIGSTLPDGGPIAETEIAVADTAGFEVGMGVVFDLGNGSGTEEYHRIVAITAGAPGVIVIEAGLTFIQAVGENIDVPEARYGISINDAGSDKNVVIGNDLYDSGKTANFNDAGTLTMVRDDNRGIDVIQVKHYVYVKNTSGTQRVAGDVVTIKGIATAIEFTITAIQGDDKVYGMVAETIANNASGYVLVKGFTDALKVNGTIDIAIDDILGTFTTACIAMKAAAGDQGFALALEGYATDNSDGVIDAYIKSPWD